MVGATTGVDRDGVAVMEVTEEVTVDSVVGHTVEGVKMEVENSVVHTGPKVDFETERGGKTSPI